jgi:hypothetical protein
MSTAGHSQDDEAVAAVPDRKCGRCQRGFAGDPALNFQAGWALCDQCRAVLLPGQAPGPARS